VWWKIFLDDKNTAEEEEDQGMLKISKHKCQNNNYKFTRCCTNKVCHKKYDEDA